MPTRQKTQTSPTKMRAFRLTDQTWQELTRLAQEYRISRTAVIEMRFGNLDRWREVFGERESKTKKETNDE